MIDSVGDRVLACIEPARVITNAPMAPGCDAEGHGAQRLQAMLGRARIGAIWRRKALKSFEERPPVRFSLMPRPVLATQREVFPRGAGAPAETLFCHEGTL